MGEPLLLTDAAESYRRDSEDRLTEIFATALDAHPQFCRSLHDAFGLPSAVRYAIATQHWANRQCRIDMRIAAFGAHDERLSVVYSEHKLEGYWFSEGQAERERGALDVEVGDEKRLICVIAADTWRSCTQPSRSRPRRL